MGVWKLLWKVTKYVIKNPQPKPIPELYFKAEKKSDVLIILAPGLNGNIEDYVPHILKPLSQHYNVYMSEYVKRGYTTSGKCMEHFISRYKKALKKYPAKRIIVVAHSMGNAMIATGITQHGLLCDAIYALTPLPRPGDSFCNNPDYKKKGFSFYFGPWLKIFRFASACFSFLQPLKIPIRIAIAGNDEVLNMHNDKRLERFIDAFNSFENVDIKVFDKRNHAFNFKSWSFRPGNRDKSEELIDDIVKFVKKIN